jgi:hypothetical protein
MQLLASLATLTRNSLRKALRSFVATCLPLLTVLALPWAVANGQTVFPYFPKYKVLGVVYAPPGSSSSVTYGNSQMVGSATTIGSDYSQAYSLSVTVSATAGIPLFGNGTLSYSAEAGWSEKQATTNTLATQSTIGNSVATAGPVSSSLGVNHDNDIIYILLNPVVVTTVPLGGLSSTTHFSGMEFSPTVAI